MATVIEKSDKARWAHKKWFFVFFLSIRTVYITFHNLLGEYLISEWRPDLILKILSDLHPNNLRQGHGQPLFSLYSVGRTAS